MLGGLDPVTAIAIAIALITAVTTVLVSVAVAGSGNSRRFTRRLQAVTARKGGEAARAGASEQRSLARRDSATPGIDRIFRLLPRREVLIERLSKTGREISVGQYMLVSFAVVAAATVGVGYFTFAKFGAGPTLLF